MFRLNQPIRNWQAQRVWLIGGSQGIGAALVSQLIERGARLRITARQPASEFADLMVVADVTDQQQLASAHCQVLDRLGGIDTLIYCAGIYQPMSAQQIDIAHVEQCLDVNLLGLYRTLPLVLPQMRQRGSGTLCLVGSVAGYTGLPNAIAYGPSKAAMINLAQSLYSELSADGISVYLVNPGFVDTRLTQQNRFSMPALIRPEQAAEEIINGLASGRFEIHFPKRFSWLMKQLSRLPDRLRLPLIRSINA